MHLPKADVLTRETAQHAAPHMPRLRAFWEGRGTVPERSRWHSLTGGRTNPVWRIETETDSFVCKLFKPSGATPLFENNPKAEILSLKALDGTGLAPHFIAAETTGLGISLIYRHVPGDPWSGDPEPVARLLRSLHDTLPPVGLRKQPCDTNALTEQGLGMLADSEKYDRMPPPPKVDGVGSGKSAFLHGDPVPGNILQAGTHLTLIDWQCPARGDACLDLAVFLSPAMQWVNGNPPLTQAQEEAFLQAYNAPETVARYHALAPLFHWRMAAYCLWKAQRGDRIYGDAAQLELARSEQA